MFYLDVDLSSVLCWSSLLNIQGGIAAIGLYVNWVRTHKLKNVPVTIVCPTYSIASLGQY